MIKAIIKTMVKKMIEKFSLPENPALNAAGEQEQPDAVLPFEIDSTRAAKAPINTMQRRNAIPAQP